LPTETTTSVSTQPTSVQPGSPLSLYHLLDPAVLANPYPLYERLRREDPVHWDPYLHSWVVARYNDVARVLHDFSSVRTPTPERLTELGLTHLKLQPGPIQWPHNLGLRGPHGLAPEL